MRPDVNDTGDITGALRGRLETARTKPNTPNGKRDGRQPEMPSDPDLAGKSEFELDNIWYEAYADKVHSFGKKWPDDLTDEESAACTAHADSIIRRPEGELWDL